MTYHKDIVMTLGAKDQIEMESDMKKRFLDLANTCFQHGHYTFSHFLSPSDMDEFFRISKELSFVEYTLFGGSEHAERKVLRFGGEEMFGYVEEFPISCIYCRPAMPKFAEAFGHRDVLGALMNLGIERDVLGDIWVHGKECYFFCLENMKEYVCDNLTKVRHTTVVCREVDKLPEEFQPVRKREEYVAASERCDVLVAKVYHLSRGNCIPLFQQNKVFVNGRQCEANSGLLKKDDVVSVRGYGKFVYLGIIRETKKGNLTVAIEKYV